MTRFFAIILVMLSVGTASAQQEVIYHIAVRSYFDSNGDGYGDLKGIQQKLNILQELGVTAISLSPIYESEFYDNRYAGDLSKTDTAFGAFKEYRDLVQDLHRRKMKLYQEFDITCVSTGSKWFKDSFKNPKSEFSEYIYYTDVKNEQAIFTESLSVNGDRAQAAAVNLKSKKVADFYTKALTYWADPDGDGNFYEGVDGFKFIGVKDAIDVSGKSGNLFKEFWSPLFAALKKVNPDVVIIAEPGSKNSEQGLYSKANADRVSADNFATAIRSLNKANIVIATDSIFKSVPAGKTPVVSIENITTSRYASGALMNAGKLKVAAALNLLLGGVPQVYYGQELGMQGKITPSKAESISSIEAFEWNASGEGEGMAFWYKKLPLEFELFAKPNDGISLEEQYKDASSLWAYYKQLIRLKKMQPALALGTFKNIHNDSKNVLSFLREYKDEKTGLNEKVLVMINLSAEAEFAYLDDNYDLRIDKLRLISGTPNIAFPRGGRGVTMNPYSVQVWRFLP